MAEEGTKNCQTHLLFKFFINHLFNNPYSELIYYLTLVRHVGIAHKIKLLSTFRMSVKLQPTKQLSNTCVLAFVMVYNALIKAMPTGKGRIDILSINVKTYYHQFSFKMFICDYLSKGRKNWFYPLKILVLKILDGYTSYNWKD